jgi:hypothetical protein
MKTRKTMSNSDPAVGKALKNFGLSEKEIAVYCESLKHQESSPFTLAQATGIPRTTVYDVLMSLSLKGLVQLNQSDGFSKQQTRIKANNPSVLRQILRQKRKDLTRTEVDIVSILPLLKGDFHGSEPHADFRFFPGIEGAKTVMYGEHADEVDVPIYVFDNQMPMDAFGAKEMDDYVDRSNAFRKKTVHKNKEIFILTDWTKHATVYQQHRNPNYLASQELRFLDNPILDFNLRLAIKETRLLITCAHEDEVWGLIINSKALSSMLHSIFEFMWLQSTPVTAELVQSWAGEDSIEFERLYKNSHT